MRMAVRVSLAWIGCVVLVGSMIMGAQAAPGLTEPVSTRLAGSVTETAKVILPETNIDGPAFTGTEIAWTGTDAAHHLNVAKLQLT